MFAKLNHLALILLASWTMGCKFELGHAVFRSHTLGTLSPTQPSGTFPFRARGRGTQFTLAATKQLRFPRGSNIGILITDQSGIVVAGANLNGNTLEATNWDSPANSL